MIAIHRDCKSWNWNQNIPNKLHSVNSNGLFYLEEFFILFTFSIISFTLESFKMLRSVYFLKTLLMEVFTSCAKYIIFWAHFYVAKLSTYNCITLKIWDTSCASWIDPQHEGIICYIRSHQKQWFLPSPPSSLNIPSPYPFLPSSFP